MALAIHLAENYVDGTDTSNDVRDDLAFDDFRKRLQVDVRRRTEVAAQRLRRTVARDETTEFTARRFNGDVSFARRRGKSFGENFEVVDERFHLRLHLFALRRNDTGGL